MEIEILLLKVQDRIERGHTINEDQYVPIAARNSGAMYKRNFF